MYDYHFADKCVHSVLNSDSMFCFQLLFISLSQLMGDTNKSFKNIQKNFLFILKTWKNCSIIYS